MIKFIGVEKKENGHFVMTVEDKFLFLFPRIRKFEAKKEYPEGYWDWLELPNLTIISDNLYFQLNAWMRRVS